MLLPHSAGQTQATMQRLNAYANSDHLKVLLVQGAVAQSSTAINGNRLADSTALTKLGDSLIYSDTTRIAGISCLRRALELDPANRHAQTLLAEVLSWGKEKKLSLTMFQELTSTEPNNLTLRSKQAAVLSWTGKLKQARKEFSNILQVDPDNRLALLGLGACYSWQGDYFKAEDILSSADRKHPRDPEIIVLRAINYRDMGRGDIAERLLDSFDSNEKLAARNKTSLSMRKIKTTEPENTQ
jgi:tetratricopeptide (TPR) repeat protein